MCSKNSRALALSKIKRLLESIFPSRRFVVLLTRRIPKCNKERRGKFLRAHGISLLETSSHLSVCPLCTSIDNQQNQFLQGLKSGFSFLGKQQRTLWENDSLPESQDLSRFLRKPYVISKTDLYIVRHQLWFRNKAVHPCSVYVTNNFQKLRPTSSKHLLNS